jgi:hypothetical protein
MNCVTSRIIFPKDKGPIFSKILGIVIEHLKRNDPKNEYYIDGPKGLCAFCWDDVGSFEAVYRKKRGIRRLNPFAGDTPVIEVSTNYRNDFDVFVDIRDNSLGLEEVLYSMLDKIKQENTKDSLGRVYNYCTE